MRLTIVLPVCLALTACASSRSEVAPVMVAPGITLALPSPGALGRNVEAVQMVAARHGGDTVVFDGRLSVEPGRLLLVCSDAMGRRAMTVTWTEAGLEVEKAGWLPENLRPENILADIVLLYWPEAVIRQGLRGAALSETTGGRTVGEAIAVSWQGDPWTGLSRLRNTAWDYDLEIRSALVRP